jgi:hypothetical protein
MTAPSYRFTFYTSLLLLFIGLHAPFAGAQNAPEGIRLLAKSKGNAVVLRWAPTSPILWQAGNRYGYKLERFTLKSDGTLAEATGGGKLLATHPIRPVSQREFEELARTEDKAAVVEEMIYGSTPAAPLTGPATILRRKQEDENRFGFALLMCDFSAPVAIAAGLQWTDKTAAAGARYIYRLTLAGAPAGMLPEPAVVVVDVKEEKPLLPPDGLKARFEDRKVTLSWPVFLHKGIYTAYVVERSTDGKNYRPLSDLPYVFFSEKRDPDYAHYVDSLPANDQPYHYRIRGLTPFAETSPVSAPVSGAGKEEWTGLAVIGEAKVLNNKQVVLSWQFPEQYHAQIKGYALGRATRPDGPYQDVTTKLIPPSQRSFTDAPPTTNSYYCLRVIDKAGTERAVSFPYLVQLEDNTPPAAPVGITGKVSPKGVATLAWPASAEADLLGYRVFKANRADEEFVEVTQEILPKPAFTDSVNLQTLTRQVCYKVVAVDRNYNPSEYSAPLELQRPDLVPPAAAQFRRVEQRGDTIRLEWDNSPSDDVVRCELYRQEKATTAALRLREWSPKDGATVYEDARAYPGQTYRYLIKLFDGAGNVTESVSKDFYYETGIRPPVTNWRVTVDRTQKRIVLDWQYAQLEATQCQIYRARAGEPLRLYKTLPGNPGEFVDKDLAVNNAYVYKIRLNGKGGVQTQLSEAMKAEY